MPPKRPLVVLGTRPTRVRRPLTAALRPGVVLVAMVVVVVAAVGVLAPAGAAIAAEPDECKALVLDPGDHVDVPRVTKAAEKVQDQAADIRVRVYDSVPDGNLDAYVRGLTKRCGTWQAADGGVKNNLVVLAVSIDDRKTGLYFGDTFASVLGHEWTGIQAQAMNPRFKAGDFTGGLLAGLTRVAHFVDPEYDPPAPRHHGTGNGHSNGGGRHGVTVRGTFTDATAGGTGGGGGGVVLLLLLGIAALIGAGVGGLAARRRHIEKVAARARASKARGEMTALFLQVEETSEFTSARVTALPTVEDSGVRAARDLADVAKGATDAAMAEYLTVEEANRDDAIAEMKTARAAAAAQAMDAVAVKLAAAATAWAAAAAKVDELEQLRVELPAQLDTVDDLVAATRGLFPTREAAGFHTADFAAEADGYATESAAVRDLLAQMRFGDADGRADALLGAAQATHARAEDLPALQARLVADVAVLRTNASSADRNLAAARQVAAALAADYQSECTAGIEEAIASATEAIAGVRVAAEELETASGMSVQRFADAEAAAARGDELTAQATEEIGVPAARRAELEALTGQLRSRLTDLRASCADLAGKVADRQDAVAHLDEAPDSAAISARLDELVADVAAARPALYTARDAVEDAARRLAAEHESVDAVVAAFDEAAERVRKAAAAVADAESESGRMHSGSRSHGLADDARVELEEAQAASDLRSRLEHADEAIGLAEEAVDEARRSRRAYQQRNNAAAFGAGLGAGGSNSNPGGGLGGGGGGGGHGGMGGGSSSFGGGGGGMGGGSSSW